MKLLLLCAILALSLHGQDTNAPVMSIRWKPTDGLYISWTSIPGRTYQFDWSQRMSWDWSFAEYESILKKATNEVTTLRWDKAYFNHKYPLGWPERCWIFRVRMLPE